MNWRAFAALIRREVQRGRRGMAFFSALAVAVDMLALALPADAAFFVATLGAMFGIVVVFSPLGDLRTDKTLGNLEFDRVLPVSHRVIATARMIGAAIRTAPIMLFVLAFIIAADHDHPVGALRVIVAVVAPVVAWLTSTGLLWALMAVNIRWNLRRLWWLPMTIFIGPNILISTLPPPVKAAIRQWFEREGTPIVEFLSTPAGLISAAIVLLAIPILLFSLAISLFAAGLERYTYDAQDAVAIRGAPPKRELAAIGRGPALAVARYCIRLATEQSRRRFVLLAVFVAVLLVGTVEMKEYARLYVRALAAMIPGGIALQLSVARTRGHLEGIQQLPHSAITIGAGYLMGIAILATPGAAVWVFARAVTGTPATVSAALSLWAWMVGWSWLASVSVVWLTSRRLLAIAAVPVIALGTWAMYVGPGNFVDSATAAVRAFRAFRGEVGVAFPLLLASAMMIGGLPLFARGLAEYEFARQAKGGRLAQWLRAREERREKRNAREN